MNNVEVCIVCFSVCSQRQIAFLGPLEWRNLFGQKSKVVSFQKLILRSGVRLLILFVLMDAILLKLDLQKRTSVLDNPPNEKLFVSYKYVLYQKIGNVFLIFNIKLP